jgi:hypothetical protein
LTVVAEARGIRFSAPKRIGFDIWRLALSEVLLEKTRPWVGGCTLLSMLAGGFILSNPLWSLQHSRQVTSVESRAGDSFHPGRRRLDDACGSLTNFGIGELNLKTLSIRYC